MTARKPVASETPMKATAARRATSVPPDRLRLYQRLIDSVEDVEAKANFRAGYTAINGNMYSMISKYGVVGIRLPEPQRTAFLYKYDTTIFRADPSWPPSKEYVAVPDQLLRNTKALRPYLELSYQYARNLRRKPIRE